MERLIELADTVVLEFIIPSRCTSCVSSESDTIDDSGEDVTSAAMLCVSTSRGGCNGGHR